MNPGEGKDGVNTAANKTHCQRKMQMAAPKMKQEVQGGRYLINNY